MRSDEAILEIVRLLVVAVPETVKPPAAVPLPIVDEPSPRRPDEKVRTLVVALLINGYAKMDDARA